MEKIKLKVAQRETKTPNQLRREGFVPATLYGPGQPSESVQVDAKELSRLPAAAFSHMIELDYGSGKGVNAIIRNVQRRSTRAQVLHLELYRVALDRKLTVTVPIKFVGVSPAVQLGGQLFEMAQEVEIECLPNDIPDFVEADLTKIEQIDTSLHFGDLKISDKVKILNPIEEVVAKVMTPRAVQEETPAAAAAPAEGAAAPAEGAAAAAPAAAPAAKAPAGKEKA